MADPNGQRKRGSMDQNFVPERLDGSGLVKSQTMRTVDSANQRDWG
jgi:hypothetical protein